MDIRQHTGFVSSGVTFTCYGGEESIGECRMNIGRDCSDSFAFGLASYLILHCLGENACKLFH